MRIESDHSSPKVKKCKKCSKASIISSNNFLGIPLLIQLPAQVFFLRSFLIYNKLRRSASLIKEAIQKLLMYDDRDR